MASSVLSSPTTSSPTHPVPAAHTKDLSPESYTPTNHSTAQTPASSLPSTTQSLVLNGGRRPPPNSVAGVAPYGAFHKGVPESELPFIPYEYENVWKDPVTTPKTRSAAASPPPSPTPKEVPADKLATLLATVPEGRETPSTPGYIKASRFTRAETVTTESTTLSEGDNVLHFNCKLRNSRIPNRNVEFLTASGVLEYSTWGCLASEDMENSLKRAKQLAVDMHKQDPRKTVEQHYNAFVDRQLRNPALDIRFTPHEEREPDASPAEVRSVEVRLEELTRQIDELRGENARLKKEMTEMRVKTDKVEEMVKVKEGKD